MKGFKDSNNKFHPITNSKGVRKSRDQSAKSEGVKIRKAKDMANWNQEDWDRMERTGKLVRSEVKEDMRQRVEEVLGGKTYLAPIASFTDPRDSELESSVTIESEVPVLTREMIMGLRNPQHYGLRITKVGTPFSDNKNDILLTVEIARLWADKLHDEGEIR